MQIGYFLHMGDETSCGGRILEGDDGWLTLGRPRARAGDQVSCGVTDETYPIVGGVYSSILNGAPAAGTLDSISGCPCAANLIPSILTHTYRNTSVETRSFPHTFSGPTLAAASQALEPDIFAAPGFVVPYPMPRPMLPPQEPGFFIVPKTTTYAALEADLFDAPSAEVLEKFRELNPRRGEVKAGEIMVISDPTNKRCTAEEALLMAVAEEIRTELADVEPELADYAADNYEPICNFLDCTSKLLGVGSAALGHHLDAIEDLLKKIEKLHIRTFLIHGNLKSPDYLAERKRLFAQLDSRMGALTRKAVGISDHPKLKTALGISNKSLLRHWSKAGAKQQIPGYATHLAGVARAAKYVKTAGYIGIAVGAVDSYEKVKEVCRNGETEDCQRMRVTEPGAFAGTVAGGTLGAQIGLRLGTPGCLFIGFGSAGVGGVICLGIVIGGGALLGGVAGGIYGEYRAEQIYEIIN